LLIERIVFLSAVSGVNSKTTGPRDPFGVAPDRGFSFIDELKSPRRSDAHTEATSHSPRRTVPASEFAKVAYELALRYPAVRTIHPIVDNLNIHWRKSLTDLLGHKIGSEVWDRFTVHYTPTHGSWLNRTGTDTKHSKPPPHPTPPAFTPE